MNYVQVLNEAFQLIWKNKIVRFFAILTTAINFLGILPFSQLFHDNHALAFVSFIGTITLFIITFAIQAALTYTAYQASLNKEISSGEGWTRGKSCIKRSIGLLALNLPLILITVGILLLPVSPFFWLLALAIMTIGGAFSGLSFCAIAIDDLKFTEAVKTGYLLTVNNLLRVFLLNGFFSLARVLPAVIVMMIYFFSPLKSELPSPLSLNYFSYTKLLGVPAIKLINQSVQSLVAPLSIVTWAIAYKFFSVSNSRSNLVTRKSVA